MSSEYFKTIKKSRKKLGWNTTWFKWSPILAWDGLEEGGWITKCTTQLEKLLSEPNLKNTSQSPNPLKSGAVRCEKLPQSKYFHELNISKALFPPFFAFPMTKLLETNRQSFPFTPHSREGQSFTTKFMNFKQKIQYFFWESFNERFHLPWLWFIQLQILELKYYKTILTFPWQMHQKYLLFRKGISLSYSSKKLLK